ncbi:MAG: plasmid maintenance system killer protein [Nitrospirales bacterium]|nr:plasmid maintenance system killer protein [Nitrospirales bacterium]NKB82836.1 plasmid maintenance system killer protein [Nitrospirales bacterium]
MILTFKCKETEKLYHGRFVKRFAGIERQSRIRLRILDAAPHLLALSNLRSNHFESLKGDRKGQYSIRINSQWRICFQWDKGATDVEIVDYH